MRRIVALIPILLLALPSLAHAAWAQGGWPFRRAVDVDWQADQGAADDLAQVQFNTLGLHQPSGEHVRVTNEAGNPLPATVLMIGPGDQMRVIFRLVRGGKRYYVYFGHPHPPQAPKALEDLPITRGLLLEMHQYRGRLAENIQQIQTAWDRRGPLIGRQLEPFLYLGHNPFDDQVAMIARYTGLLNASVEGIAAAASDKAAIELDDKPLLFVPSAPGDTRFRASINLKRGPHKITLYHLNVGGEQRLSVVWSRPDDKQFKLIPPEAFGIFHTGQAGPLESNGKQYLADFKIDYLGECFFDNHYTHRYRFTASNIKTAAVNGPKTTCTWDFGDGQTASGPIVEHVYLADGPYVPRLSMKTGLQTDSRENRLVVSRLWEKIDNPPSDLPSVQARIIADYDVPRIPAAQLQWAVLLNERARQDLPLEHCAIRLAALTEGMDPAISMGALAQASSTLAARGHLDAALRIWQAVPSDSPFQPFAVKHQAKLLLWSAGDFAKAAAVLQPFFKSQPNDLELKRLYAQSLTLNQQVAEGKKLLESIPPQSPPDRQAALTGALARTIEFYINDHDWEAGQQAWEKWQEQYPSDFLEGYSILLQTRLMELAQYPTAAASVAQAFALAIPRSSYAPKLLDRASKLLQSSDPQKSRALHELLKKNYPEDPLAQ